MALVTGSDSGTGRATALAFAREGADIAVHHNTDQRGDEQSAEAIRKHGRGSELFQAAFDNLALFLASDEASYITGSLYVADGGLSLSIQGT